jgi:hypothetical protein
LKLKKKRLQTEAGHCCYEQKRGRQQEKPHGS